MTYQYILHLNIQLIRLEQEVRRMLEMNRIYTFQTHVPRSSISEYSETRSYYSDKDWRFGVT